MGQAWTSFFWESPPIFKAWILLLARIHQESDQDFQSVWVKSGGSVVKIERERRKRIRILILCPEKILQFYSWKGGSSI